MIAEKATEFFLKYGYYDVSKDLIKTFIDEHLKHNTLEILWDNNEIIALCRYNLIDNYCDILDVVIRPDFRRKYLLQKLLLQGINKWKILPRIRFKRGLRTEQPKEYDMKRFLRIK